MKYRFWFSDAPQQCCGAFADSGLMSRLEEQLKQYAESGVYPMHMPGHKRLLPPVSDLPYQWDVTEVPGTDDLHDAEGILADAMKRTAHLYGAARTFYLVGGSTCGILAGIRAMVLAGARRKRAGAACPAASQDDAVFKEKNSTDASAGGSQSATWPTLIIARNCHRSVFHAVELTGARVCWIEPEEDARFEICRGITAEQVREALAICPEAMGVVLTSPTYEGVLSDIPEIAKVCHEAGVPLMVDEAHGAHLGLFERDYFPDGALRGGADIVIQSAHKTLPSLTQTAWLHLGRMDWMADAPAENAGVLNSAEDGGKLKPAGNVDISHPTEGLRISNSVEDLELSSFEEDLKLANSAKDLQQEISRQLDVFETSSPSYPLMVSLDGCTELLLTQGEEIFRQWKETLQRFYGIARNLKCLEVLTDSSLPSSEMEKDGFGAALHDPSKILINGRRAGLTGAHLAQLLREDYGFETEMSCGYNVLAMTGAGDDPTAIERFGQAILEIDGKCFSREIRPETQEGASEAEIIDAFGTTASQDVHRHAQPYFGELTILDAVSRPSEEVPEAESCDRICAEYVYCYPPGVPILIPGEKIKQEELDRLESLRNSGTRIRRSAGDREQMLLCVISS